MRRRISPYLTMAIAVVAVFSSVAPAEEEPVAAAREVFAREQKSVVWVSAVMKMRAGGGLGAMMGRQEQKVESVGTVIDESGLTVLSYSVLDPSALLNAAMQNAGGGVAEGENKIEFKTELSGVKIRMADGTEVPAKLVLRDDDLDLAFVMPTQPGKKFPHLNLTAAGNAPEVKPLDLLIVLWRLGQSLDRQPAVAISRVSAVVSKPRTFYLCSGVESLGTPAFTADGKPLGIVVMRKQGLDAGSGNFMSMMSSGGISPIIVPAADVAEVAQQALAKKDTPPAADAPPTDPPAVHDAPAPARRGTTPQKPPTDAPPKQPGNR